MQVSKPEVDLSLERSPEDGSDMGVRFGPWNEGAVWVWTPHCAASEAVAFEQGPTSVSTDANRRLP